MTMIFSSSQMRTLLVKAAAGIGIALMLQGCPLMIVGAAGGGLMLAADRRTVGTQTEDRGIQIKTTYQIDHQLPKTAHVSVTVFNRRALLTGEAPSAEASQQAETIVRNTANVESVTNQIAIQPAASLSSRLNDYYLVTRVKAALVGTKNISANHFKVVSERGNIYLMGLVTLEEGTLGAQVISQVSGVQKVIKVYQYISDENAKLLQPGKPAPVQTDQNAATSENKSGTVAIPPAATTQTAPIPTIMPQQTELH